MIKLSKIFRLQQKANLIVLKSSFMLMLIISFSCSTSLEKQAYVKFVTDQTNNLRSSAESGVYVLDLQYLPLELRALQNGIDMHDKNAVEQFKESADKLQYYKLVLSTKDPAVNPLTLQLSTKEEKQAREYYYSYTFQNDLVLEQGKDRLPCLLFHMEKNSRFSNYLTFLVAFEKGADKVDEHTLVINCKEIGPDPIKITISKSKIPALSI